MIFKGNCWKFGDNVPSDALIGGQVMFKTVEEMAEHVFENLNPDFPKQRQPGDIVVAGRNFGCSSGRALAVKALQATGIGCVVAELFSRTFYRNAAEIGLPILEVPGIHEFAETGQRLHVDIKTGRVENLTTGKSLQGNPPSEFMLDMVEAGGLIPLLKAGKFFERYGGRR
ncbi:MAG TPA: 3-isopropylmalate dehydratase [Bryobacteraceae bacterium]|nr:3-isopropylmalate dehydratase [Bryobacteraceae bacterium]